MAPVNKPPASNDAISMQGEPRVISQRLDIKNGEEVGSIYQIGVLPATAILDLHASRLTTAGVAGLTGDLGFYKQNGEVIDVDAIAAGLNLATATSDNLAGAAGGITADKVGQPAWQWAGFTSNPGIGLVLALTSTAAPTADGLVSASIAYTK